MGGFREEKDIRTPKMPRASDYLIISFLCMLVDQSYAALILLADCYATLRYATLRYATLRYATLRVFTEKNPNFFFKPKKKSPE
jgi:hypothetical protein